MVNKQNLWFVTLFSLILVLGIYYVSMSDESLRSLTLVVFANMNLALLQ